MDSSKIGAYIQLKRKSAGLTQTQLGDMLGITSKAVSKWETGVAIPDVSLFPELTKILNITMEELLQGEDNKVVPPEKKKRNIIIVLSIILSLVTILLITTIIYFKSNYKKVEIYKLESANKDFYVEGSLTNVGDKSYLSIARIDYLGSEINLFEEVSEFKYQIEYKNNIIFDNKFVPKNGVLFLKNYLGFVSFFSSYTSNKLTCFENDLMLLKFYYTLANGKNKELNLKIKINC